MPLYLQGNSLIQKGGKLGTSAGCCCKNAPPNCCSCPGPFYAPIDAGYPEIPAVPPAPTVCNPSAPSFGDGWHGSFPSWGTYSASSILTPCASPFPPYYAEGDVCGLPASNWKQDDGFGCDLEWVADSAAPYIEANCTIKVWLSASSRSTWAERDGDGGCECASGMQASEYAYRLFVANCDTGNWEDKTTVLVKRWKYRLCSGAVYSYGGADCSTFSQVPALWYAAPLPDNSYPGCGYFP